MKPICILGDGQLGRMLRQAGEPLGIAVYPVGLDADPESIPYSQSIITAEIERWPETPLTRLLAQHTSFTNRTIFPLLADRLPQKQLLDSLALPSSPWQALESPQQWADLFAELGPHVMVKRRIGGYDGRGLWQICPGEQHHLPQELYGAAIVERRQAFSAEVSLVGARSRQGECIFYPLTRNLHQQGILLTSVALPLQSRYQAQAEQMLSAIMQRLDYVGVMAMECFIVEQQLLINELAPRVHNSGHWTQNGASISQFELHLRALLDLPLPTPVTPFPAVMINLLGLQMDPRWLSLPLIHLHWYDKQVRPGRKVGHLNLSADTDALRETLAKLTPMLPDHYHEGLNWAQQQLVTDV